MVGVGLGAARRARGRLQVGALRQQHEHLPAAGGRPLIRRNSEGRPLVRVCRPSIAPRRRRSLRRRRRQPRRVHAAHARRHRRDVVAFEPGAADRWYLRSSLLALRPPPKAASRVPARRRRRRRDPAAPRCRQQRRPLSPRRALVEVRVQGWELPETVVVRTLDSVLWPERARPPPSISLLKLDVEGFECKALVGMRALLGAAAVRLVKAEVFDDGLRAGLLGRRAPAGAPPRRLPPLRRRRRRRPAGDPLARATPLAAETALHSTEPYNLYAVSSSIRAASSRQSRPRGGRGGAIIGRGRSSYR